MGPAEGTSFPGAFAFAEVDGVSPESEPGEDRASATKDWRARLRRGQLVVGVGFFAFAVGAMLTSAALPALEPLLTKVPAGNVRLFVFQLIAQFWLWAIVPLFSLALARGGLASSWRSPLAMAVTGFFFVFALRHLTSGSDAWTGLPGALLLAWLVSAAVGVGASVQAIRWAGRKRGEDEASARAIASAQRDAYPNWSAGRAEGLSDERPSPPG